MRSLYLRYDREAFWRNYWAEVQVDPPLFKDLDIYPIHPTLKHLKKDDAILECGFGGGRVVRHLVNTGFSNVVGAEYDVAAALRLNAVQSLNLCAGDVCRLPFRSATFDAVMAFGVLGGLQGVISDALEELVRVTRRGGLVIASFMLGNLARTLQLVLNRMAPGNARFPLEFYAWTDSVEGWTAYLRRFGLKVIDRSLMVSRYNFYYWTPFLRARGATFDHALARVSDREFRLNSLGEAVFRITRRVAPRQFAGAALFVCTSEQ